MPRPNSKAKTPEMTKPPDATPPTPNQENRPVHVFRHRRLKATIWRNPTQRGLMYTVTIIRSFRDTETGEWRDTHTLSFDDLMNVAGLMHQAHAYIANLMAEGSTQRRASQGGKPIAAGDLPF